MRHAVLAALLALLCLAGAARAEPLRIYAAASLADVLTEAGAVWGAETGHDVTVVAVASSTLARQVAAGAAADIVIPASADWMDWLAAQGALARDTRRDLMANRLVVVGRDAGETDPATALTLPDGARLAVALTEAVPAGQYAKAALQSLGLWDGVKDKLAETDNVRAALALVALGAAPRGIVYATDALAEPRVHVLAVLPAGSHPPIRYPGAVTARAGQPDAALALLDWLGSEAGRNLLAQHGFVPPQE